MKNIIFLVLCAVVPSLCIGFSEPIIPPVVSLKETCSLVLDRFTRDLAKNGIKNNSYFIQYAEYGRLSDMLKSNRKFEFDWVDILNENIDLSNNYGWLIIILRSPDLTQSEAYFLCCKNKIFHLSTSD